MPDKGAMKGKQAQRVSETQPGVPTSLYFPEG